MGMVFQAYSLFPNMTARAERRVRPADPGSATRRAARSACASCSSSSVSAHAANATRTSSRAACSSASRSRARWRSSRACCSSTSRSRRSTRRYASSSARRSAASRPSSGSRRSTSRTTRRRRSRSPTASPCMYGGRIEQVGRRPRCTAAPATPFVAEFVGTMNRLEATVVAATAPWTPAARGSRSTRRGPATGERVLVLSGRRRRARGGDDGGGLSPAARSFRTRSSVRSRASKVDAGDGEDGRPPTVRVEALPVGSRVVARSRPRAPGSLTLTEPLEAVLDDQ